MGQALTWVILGIGLFVFFFVGLIWALYMRSKYQKEVVGKRKCVFFSEGLINPKTYILPVSPDGGWVEAPQGHQIGAYIVDKNRSWDTKYPEEPFMGLKFIQVSINTSWYGVDNPEPVTPFTFKPKNTAANIMAFANRKTVWITAEAQKAMDAYRKENEKLRQNKLNAMVVYVGLVIIALGIGIAIYFASKEMTYLKTIAQSIGVTLK